MFVQATEDPFLEDGIGHQMEENQALVDWVLLRLEFCILRQHAMSSFYHLQIIRYRRRQFFPGDTYLLQLIYYMIKKVFFN